MKESFYNIYVPLSDKIIAYNTLRDNYALLSMPVYNKIQEGKISELEIKDSETLKETGCVVDEEINELELLKEEYASVVSKENGVYELTLLPSLDCNLRCWYCFEHHVKGSRMASVVQDNIFQYVSTLLEKENIQYLNVEMFGGEPLLYFEEELYPLLKRIQTVAEEKGKGVSFFFVTNATCIKEKHIPMFADLKAKFQISIDGYKEKHNQVKRDVNSKEATYEKVMNIIHLLCNSYDECYINLRINYDNETLQHIGDVIRDIVDIDRKKLGIHLERVWQTTGDKDSSNWVKNAIKLILGNGFTCSYMNLSRRSYSCKTSKVNQSIISFDGKVYKCSGRNFTPELQEGQLNATGEIIWDTDKLQKRLGIQTYKHEKCESCKLLPLCWGPCAQKQLEYPNEISRFCQLENMEMSLEEYVYFAFNNQLINNKLYEET